MIRTMQSMDSSSSSSITLNRNHPHDRAVTAISGDPVNLVRSSLAGFPHLIRVFDLMYGAHD